MTGPSASGSENGTPISRTSAPALSRRLMMSADRCRSGSPAVTYVTRPVRPSLRSCVKRSSIRDMRAFLEDLLHAVDVLVAAARQVDEQDRVLRKLLRNLLYVRNRMSGFERRQDAFETRQLLEAGERVGVGRVIVFGAPDLLQPRVFRPHRRVIETGRDRMRRFDVAVCVLQHPRPRALQDTRCAAGEPRRMTAGTNRFATSFHADQTHVAIVDERIDDADR